MEKGRQAQRQRQSVLAPFGTLCRVWSHFALCGSRLCGAHQVFHGIWFLCGMRTDCRRADERLCRCDHQRAKARLVQWRSYRRSQSRRRRQETWKCPACRNKYWQDRRCTTCGWLWTPQGLEPAGQPPTSWRDCTGRAGTLYRVAIIYGRDRTIKMCLKKCAPIYGRNVVFCIKKDTSEPQHANQDLFHSHPSLPLRFYRGLQHGTQKTVADISPLKPPKHCLDFEWPPLSPTHKHISSPSTIKPESCPFLDGPQKNWGTKSTAYQRASMHTFAA